MLIVRTLLVAIAVALCAPAAAQATALFDVSNGQVTYIPDGGGFVDQIAILETPTAIRFVRFGQGDQPGDGAGCDLIFPSTVDCTKNGVNVANIPLGDNNDIASVSSTVKIPVILNGGAGNDGLFGGGGQDTFIGGPGDDNIVARDGRSEQVDCGEGHDTAITDDSDVRISCEEIEGDADNDGVRRPADCDDTNPLFRPGVTDVFDNGIDENCDGVDAVNTDRDADGSPRPQDCDDADAAIHPGAREVIGNQVDENCDTRIEPFPPLTGSVTGTWQRVGRRTANLTLVAKGFQKGTSVALSCVGKNCPKGTKRSTIRNTRRPVNLHVLIGRRAIAKGARVEVRLTAAQRVGRLLRYRMITPGVPSVAFLCVPPGRRAGPC